MKICFIIGSLSYSGAEKVLSYLIEDLKKNHDISVILNGRLTPKKTINNGFDEYAGACSGNKIIRTFRRMGKTRKIVKDNNFDIVVSFGTVASIGAIPSLIGVKTPLIVCERNDPSNTPVELSYRLRRKIFYYFATGYIFQTKEISEYFSRRIQRNGYIIPNPVIDVQESYVYNKKRKVIATVARLDDFQKNQSCLIRVFSQFLNVKPSYDLEIYGDGPDKEKYIKLVEELKIDDKVRFFGKVNNPLTRIKTADIFVLTSNFEGMPNALIEAMSIGLPCISTDFSGGGASALINNGENGILIPMNNDKALLKALLKTSNDSCLKRKLGRNAHMINKKLNIETIAGQWEDVLMDCIKKFNSSN